jgi:hypothetical protein
MAVTVTITDESGSGRVAGALTLDGIDERITLRDLVRARVREEVVRYNSQREEERGDIFAGLVMPEGAEPARDGFRMPTRRVIDWEQQADRAIRAFTKNGFFVLVGDRQVTDLDEELNLTAGSDIRFIRLVQLVGG